MKNYLSNFEKKLLKYIRDIGREADKKDVHVYLVGGIIRDILLKKGNYDFDFAVEGDAIALSKVLEKKWKAKLIRHNRFKTARLDLPGKWHIDLASTRKERYTHSGALPIVKSGNLRNDLFRRDFTINALAVALNTGCFGKLIDEFNGLSDLANKKIRIMHDQSFIDDPTRILRAIRFEQRLQFQIERKTLSLLKKAINSGAVNNVKPPRYFSEFKKILCERDPIKPLKRLHTLDGLQFLSPRFSFQYRKLNNIHENILKLNKEFYEIQRSHWWFIYFIGLINNGNNQLVGHISQKFSFKRHEKKSLQQICKIQNVLKKLSVKQLLASEVYQILKPLTKEIVLFIRVYASSAMICRRIDQYLAYDRKVILKINGNDLKKIGVNAGHRMGRILENVLCSKIDKKLSTKREELKEVYQFLD